MGASVGVCPGCRYCMKSWSACLGVNSIVRVFMWVGNSVLVAVADDVHGLRQAGGVRVRVPRELAQRNVLPGAGERGGNLAVPERVQHVRVHGAVAERALDEPCLARRVLVHQAVVNVKVGFAGNDRLAERPPDHRLGGAPKVGFPLARHQLLPLFAEQKHLSRLLVGRPFLFDGNHNWSALCF